MVNRPCHLLLYCSCILRLKQLYVTAEGTRRAHVPAASGLGFRPPGCEPKPVRFFNRPSGCRSHLPRLQREIAVHDLHPSRIWLGFRPPGCEPKPVRFFNRPSGCRSHLPRPQREIAVHDLHLSRIWLGFLPSRVRTKTCPLFQSPVWMPLASPATPARNRRARLASQPHLAWVFALQGANQNLSAFLPQDGGMLSGHELGSRSQRSLSRLLPGSSDGLRE